jgi:response regulator RpfG family c-di-GMP phosphodiesterase
MPAPSVTTPVQRPVAAEATKVLCVDDDIRVVDGLALHLRRRYATFTATSGVAGLEILRNEAAIAVIVSDMRMPGMDGAAFLAQAREIAPDAVRILLTGDTDLLAAATAVNDGQLFRFLIKPCPADKMVAAVDAAVAQHRLITAERVLLEETLHGSIKALTDVLAVTNPVTFGRAVRLKHLVSELAERLEMRERWQVEVAAMLSQIGTIALPPETAEKVGYGRPLTAEEQAMLDRAPAVVEQILGSIPRLDGVRAIIAGMHRKPLRTPGSADGAVIARGAGMLRIVADFDALEAQGLAPALALDTLLGRPERYDPVLLRAFEELQGVHRGRDDIRQVPLAALQVGMVLTEEVRLLSGTLLASRGYEITASFVERTRNSRDTIAQKSLRVLMPRTGIDAAAAPPVSA